MADARWGLTPREGTHGGGQVWRGDPDGGEIRNLVSLVDVPPTLLDVAGIDVPDAM